MGLVGRREAMSAPTVGNASESTPVNTARVGPGLSPSGPGGNTSPVRKSSKRASPRSATHPVHSDQANHAALRWLIPPAPRSWFLASFVTTITLPQYLLQSITIIVHRTVLWSEGTTFREHLLLGIWVNRGMLCFTALAPRSTLASLIASTHEPSKRSARIRALNVSLM
jgi:hypothetical protein